MIKSKLNLAQIPGHPPEVEFTLGITPGIVSGITPGIISGITPGISPDN